MQALSWVLAILSGLGLFHLLFVEFQGAGDFLGMLFLIGVVGLAFHVIREEREKKLQQAVVEYMQKSEENYETTER